MAAVTVALVDSSEMTDDKPFECTTPGCGQRFANNDHLESHKQKHQLSLKLGNLKPADLAHLADQTPTPTRFLKNLEEEGLFEDLENPFDQEFKKAAAPSDSHDSKKDVAVLPKTEQEETVRATSAFVCQASLSNGGNKKVVVIQHSSQQAIAPTVLQTIATSSIPSVVNSETAKVVTESVTEAPRASAVSVLVRVPPYMPAIIPAAIANPNIPVPSALPVPRALTRTTAQNTMPISIPTPAIVSSPVSSNGKSFHLSAKERLKETLRQQQNNNSNGMNIVSQAMTEAVEMVTSEHNGLTTSPTMISHNNQQNDSRRGIKRPRRSQEELDPDERRRKFLERNRAAATRCREKRKIWVQQLEKKADDLSNTNTQLQNEISLLRTEVAQLKSLLLAHKDCPVTIAQQKMAAQKQMNQGQVHVSEANGINAVAISMAEGSAEDVATSALTQLSHRAALELEGYLVE
ncbi:cyclic AMP-dependent transcription factor ATF-2 [Nematostella vectensis]|nr:cyclic AMP-dependent transcription factor ATF-2 [Nematostella vectensis]